MNFSANWSKYISSTSGHTFQEHFADKNNYEEWNMEQKKKEENEYYLRFILNKLE